MCASRTEVRVDGRAAPVTMPGAAGLFRASAAALDETVLRETGVLVEAIDSELPLGLVRWPTVGLGLAAPTPTVDRRAVAVVDVAPAFFSAETTVLSLRDVDLTASSPAPTLAPLRCPRPDVEAVDRCTEGDERVCVLFKAGDRAPGPTEVLATVDVAVALA